MNAIAARVHTLLALCLLLMANRALALELQPERHYRELAPDLRYELNDYPVETDPAVIRARVADHFAAVPGQQIDFGFTAKTIWLYLPVGNLSAQQARWVLSLNTRFMNDIAVYQSGAAGWRQLLHTGSDSSFAERPIDFRRLAVDFTLAGGERGALLIGYRSRGTSFLPLSIESGQSFADMRALANAHSAGFYTAAALMLIYGLFQWLLVGNRIHLHYILYLGAAVLYVFHMDGLSFQFLWPQLPHWNAYAALPLGLLINIAAANFARRFLQTWRTAPGFDRAILAIVGLCVLAMLWGIFIEDQQVKRFGFWLSTVGALVYLAVGIKALVDGQRFARFYVAGWVGICCAAVVSTLVHSLPGLLPVSLGFEVTKAGILFDALMFGVAMADQAVEVRRQRDAALAREMQSLAEQAKTRSALRAAEAGRADALRLARAQSMQLASASHDIRQPLASLKLALSQHAGQPESAEALESVAYLDALVSNYLDTASEDEADAEEAQVEAVREPFPVQLVLDAVHRMFTPEAEARGLTFRRCNSSLRVLGDPVATVRIASNLVKNAIQHTEQGGVLIGCRRLGERCVLCVVDSGEGIAAQERERLLGAFQQGDEAQEGHGLGLHIVSSLSARLGYDFSLDSGPRGGSTARVSLPIATV